MKAVYHCHSKKITLRNLNPENILFNKNDNSLKIIDYGAYIGFDKQITSNYLAPEVFYNPGSD